MALQQENLPVQIGQHEEVEVIINTVDSILSAVEHRQAARAAILDASMSSPVSRTNISETVGGPLSSHDLSKLSLICTEVSATTGTLTTTTNHPNFSIIDTESLSSLCSMLEIHIDRATSIDMIQETHELLLKKNGATPQRRGTNGSNLVEEWLRGLSNPRPSSVGPGVLRYLILRNGLEAAGILLHIMISPNIDRRIISEDSIESIIALLRHHLTRNIGPALSHTGHLMANTGNKPSSAKKRRRTSGGVAVTDQRLMKELKKVYKAISLSIPQILNLIEATERLIQTIQIDDRHVLILSSTALSIFTMDPVVTYSKYIRLFHIASVSLLTAISKRYPQHRSVVVEDILPILLQLPSSKKVRCTYPISLTRTTSISKLESLEASRFANCKKRRRSSIGSVEGGEETSNLQAISVLILSLIQSCVIFPTYEGDNDDEGNNREKGAANNSVDLPNIPRRRRKSGITTCQKLCDYFVTQLLKRCSRKGEDGGASEFRPVLNSLVDDFLIMQLLPEYPSAEMILLTLCKGLGNDIFKASSFGVIDSRKNSTNNNVTEATYLSTAFDILGNITSCMAELLACQRESPISITKNIEDNLQSNSRGNKVNSCFCGRTSLVDTLMVSCDRCKGFYHAQCVNQTRETIKEDWMCDDCTLKDMAIDVIRDFSTLRSPSVHRQNSEKITPTMETHVFRQLILTYLSNKSDTPGIHFAREFLLAQWVKELDTADSSADAGGVDSNILAQYFLDIWNRPLVNPLTAKLGSDCPLSDDGYRRLMIALFTSKSELVRSFPKQMGLLIQFMGDEKLVSMRKLAVKALSQVVDADSYLMLHPSLKNAVSERFADAAKSVREAVVGLVGSFVISCPELANAFHSSFLPRLMDEGVSVKKRTVKIFRDILMTNPSYNGRAEACVVMLQRAADPKEDDGVRDLIHEVFTEMWLENSYVISSFKRSTLAGQEEFSNQKLQIPVGTSVVTPITEKDGPLETPTRLSQNKSNIQVRCRLASEQMIEIVLTAGSKDMLATLLRNLIGALADTDKDRKVFERNKRRQNAASHCCYLVDGLIDNLLLHEEIREKSIENFGEKLLAIIRTIGAVAEVSSREVVRHVDTLLPYLKADNGVSTVQEGSILTEVCDILRRVSRVMSQGEINKLAQSSISNDIEKITYRFGSITLSFAVAALCEFGNHGGISAENPFRQKAMKLACIFYRYLTKNSSQTDFSKVKKNIRNNIQRALSVLGALCRSHASENKEITWLDEVMEENFVELPETITWDSMVEVCYKIFMVYLKKADVETQCSALKALTGIFVSRPRILLAMQKAGTIASIMSPKSDAKLLLQALRCWREILIAEEKRVESGDAKAKMDSNENITLSQKISGDQDGDATLVGGVLTQHNRRLYALTKDKREQIRYACVDLISHLLRQGLLNPFQTIPYLFGLQGDIKKPEIRALALKLLIHEGEKRPDMLRQRICAGVKNAFMFQRNIYTDSEVTAGILVSHGLKTGYESIFGSIFKASMSNIKKQKHGLFINLLSLFNVGEIDLTEKKEKGKKAIDLSLLSFTSEVLAYLPYNTANDPLFIIYHIQNSSALQGAQHLDKISNFLQEQGFPSNNDDLYKEDDLEIAAKSGSPSLAKEATPMNCKKFDIIHFEQLCEIASSFVLLLRLKSYLREVYNLSETRCLEYSPDGQGRNFDKTSSIINMPRFNSKIPDQNVYKNARRIKEANKDALIMQYTEFRRLMRDEQISSRSGDEIDEDNASLHSSESG